MKITSFQIIKPYQIKVLFEDGKSVIADLEEFLRTSTNPLITQFLDIKKFYDVNVDDFGVLVWGDDDMDINPLKIYEGYYSVENKVANLTIS